MFKRWMILWGIAAALATGQAQAIGLTSPTAGQLYLAPASVTLTATAADSDGTITKVEFYQGTTLIGTATAAPYSITWTNAPAGYYALSAKATDDKGITSSSNPAKISIDAPPTVSLTAPANNTIYVAPASVTLTATAADSDDSITKVEFYRGTTLIGTDTAAPYGINWTNAPAGSYTLTARATDKSGATTTSAPVQIIVDAPPSVSLTAPANKAVYIAPASVTLTATAGDSDGTISKVEYYQGTTLIGTATSAPYIATWQNAPAGQYSLTAKATDDKGATTTSTAVTIIVLPNQLPSITLTGPTAGQTFTAPATIDLAASAQDTDGQIARVEYYQGTTLIGTATAAPYSATWQNVAAGQYSLTAKAIDNGGGESYASAVSITVSPAGLQVYYLHSDHLDTPRVVTDEQNRIVWRNDPLAEPFGTAAPEQDPDGDGVPFTLNLRFPGQYFDKETNLHYNWFRDYDPARGGYTTSDPIGLKGGINTYSYVSGNPISRVDLYGLESSVSFGLGVTAAAGWGRGGGIDVNVSITIAETGVALGFQGTVINKNVYGAYAGWGGQAGGGIGDTMCKGLSSPQKSDYMGIAAGWGPGVGASVNVGDGGISASKGTFGEGYGVFYGEGQSVSNSWGFKW
ncbi:hypothetical protein SKTS_26120 [Sulfurimicrobium lacus]|uniref:PKD/Chitinase domain-containing protein n=1 Tax=Sulfurimicrobium lacus TaxID=2715678 RepID=A0A6F8VFC2_9PROT|nr:Ig-like domain-containing protein [Sulfurimicrobium lacus]BCB27726.1 hypothetical protein SKTS_26120 [Sulfurimicrobium lacus]